MNAKIGGPEYQAYEQARWREAQERIARQQRHEERMNWLRLYPFIANIDNHDPGDEDR